MLEVDGWANIGGPLLLSTAIYSYQPTVDSLSTDRSNVVLLAVATLVGGTPRELGLTSWAWLAGGLG